MFLRLGGRSGLTVWKPLNLCTLDRMDPFICSSYLSFIPIAVFVGMESMRKRKRKHGNHVVHIVTFYDNKCRRMRPFGGRNPEFGVNHVHCCLLYVFTLCCSVSIVFYMNVAFHMIFIKQFSYMLQLIMLKEGLLHSS